MEVRLPAVFGVEVEVVCGWREGTLLMGVMLCVWMRERWRWLRMWLGVVVVSTEAGEVVGGEWR